MENLSIEQLREISGGTILNWADGLIDEVQEIADSISGLFN